MSLPEVELNGRFADEWIRILHSAGFSVDSVPLPDRVYKAFVISRGPDIVKALWIGPPDAPVPSLILVSSEGPTAPRILEDVLATFEAEKDKCAKEH
jgi:hypothetical protein